MHANLDKVMTADAVIETEFNTHFGVCLKQLIALLLFLLKRNNI